MKLILMRALVGAYVGAGCGLVALAVYGAAEGLANGAGARPPGPDAAWRGALFMAAYFWWLAVPVGGAMGGIAGTGSALAGLCLRRNERRDTRA
ncbi:MAG TPA: hypothetical protein VG013_32925 [Gemmataceae bacterium]|nr:hypothetical protein [Gemmataceae bacterium]